MTHSVLNLNSVESVTNDAFDDANVATPSSSFRSLLNRLHSSSTSRNRLHRGSDHNGSERHATPIASHAMTQNNDQRSRENRLTRISLSIVWLFIFCHVWKLVPTMYEGFHEIRWDSSGESGKKVSAMVWPEWLSVINDVSHTLIVFNSAVNFLIYVTL